MRLTAAALLLLLASPAVAGWPTTGGDAGRVIHVTSLADDGPGSLRVAVEAKGPRRIVFDIGGEIFLKSPLKFYEPAVTVAGDTAPAPGVTILGDKLHVRTNDVILRSLRIRVGELPGSNPSSRDGISIEPNKKKPAARILIDHCSVLWALDEAIGLWGHGVSDVLVRDTIVAETLRNSIQPKGGHSMGMLVGAGATNVVIEANLFASNMYRNPVVDAGSTAVVVNNLIYNPGKVGFHVYGKPKEGPTLVSVVGNVLLRGPDTTTGRLRSFDHGVDAGSQIYFHDNLAPDAKAFSTAELAGKVPEDPVPFVASPPIWFDWLKPLPAGAVADAVLAHVGPRPLDAEDSRIIAEARSRTGGVRDTPGDPRLRVPRPLKSKAE